MSGWSHFCEALERTRPEAPDEASVTWLDRTVAIGRALEAAGIPYAPDSGLCMVSVGVALMRAGGVPRSTVARHVSLTLSVHDRHERQEEPEA